METLPDLSGSNIYLVQIPSPLLPQHSEDLEKAGAILLENFRNGYYTSLLTSDQASDVEQLPFVTKVIPYNGESLNVASGSALESGREAGLESLGDSTGRSDQKQILTFDVRLHRESDLGAVLDWLKKSGASVAGQSRRKIRIYVLEDSPVITELSRMTEVRSIEEYKAPRLWNDRACAIVGIRSNTARLKYDGEDQIIGVADTGLDDAHPDFRGRVLAAIALGRPGRTDDPDGHGTHVAGTALGDGAASRGAFQGAAPKAKLVFQSILDNRGELGGLPLDLNDLFEEAYQRGARIHNNSWGADTVSTYTANSEEVDEFVADHRDMLIVIAAGNEGQGVTLLNANQGFVDWLSIGSPATAKNALTVGASRSDRTSGGYSRLTWGSAWPASFPFAPISSESISGDAQEIAGFSSRGPSDDRRIKPDVVAPGTDILSCKSRLAPNRSFWGHHTNQDYAYNGGTSMAAPLVAGCAAIVRQYYKQERGYDEPSAALVRATIINGARWLSGIHATGSHAPGPGNFDQGFGCVDMTSSIPADASFKLAYVDAWKTPNFILLGTGAAKRWIVRVVDSSRPLRICLAYTDLPGRALQNNLNLFVQAPNGTKHIGNHKLLHSLNIPDVDNNVEVVRIDAPTPGDYWVQVTAQNLLRNNQDFALVVTGALRADILTPR